MALFHWKERKRWGGAEIGDTRTVRKLILIPRCLGGEWRWLGLERVKQEHARWKDCSPGSGFVHDVRGWRDVDWGR